MEAVPGDSGGRRPKKQAGTEHVGEEKKGEAARAPAASDHGSSPSNLHGIAAMVAATALFTLGDATMKIVSGELPTGELVFLRGLISATLLFIVALWTGALATLKHALGPALALRCLGDAGGALMFQSALARMHFANIMAIIQLTPLTLTAASAMFLRERVGWRRWTAVAIGFCGALLIIKPGTSAFDWWAVIAMLSVLSGALRDIATRRIDMSVSPFVILMVSQVAVSVACLGLMPFETWRMPSLLQIGKVAFAAVFSLVGHLCVIYAIRSGEISAVAPFRYASIVWAILLGLVIWGHLPDLVTFLGIFIVATAGLYTFFREQHLQRQRLRMVPKDKP